MKKLLFIVAAATAIVSCDSIGNSGKSLQAENDSLVSELNSRNAELDEMMGTFNEISEGFRQINEAEDRVDLNRGTIGEGVNSREVITRDIEFIRNQMQSNKEQIAKLESMLKSSKTQSTQLKKAIAGLTAQLQEKQKQIEDLQSELASKNIRIQELDDAVSSLTEGNKELTAQNEAKAQTVASQDAQLHKAWFVFGTKKELKEQNIISESGLFKKTQVLTDGDINMDYFTECDIRTQKQIKLYSKTATLLTNHPKDSYNLEKDSKDQLTLNITNPDKFWSASKYLVIQVK